MKEQWKERARVFQRTFSCSLSFNSEVLLLLMSPKDNFKRSFKQKDPITNLQGREKDFEKRFEMSQTHYPGL